MNRKTILHLLLLLASGAASAGPDNIAPLARVSASSAIEGAPASAATDGIIRVDGRGEWVADNKEEFWGETNFPHLRLDWDSTMTISRVVLYDRVTPKAHAAGAVLRFSDGSRIDVGQIPESGAPREISFPPKSTDWLQIEITDGNGSNIGLSEVEVFPAPESYADYVAHVNPYIETTRGRYFFFITGNQPYGMIGAAPMTRNKNQGGGGYNYNDSHILGFPQIHGWMMAGLDYMPVSPGTDPTAGEQGWKSRFLHEGEIVQPAYHRLYLEDHNVWVEQTATERTSMYRLNYTTGPTASMLINLGGYIGTATMVNAHVDAVSPTRLEGYFDTTGRLWGGPEYVRVFFVTEFSKPFTRLDAWNDKERFRDVTTFTSTTRSTPRNEGMSYHDAPSAGVIPVFANTPGEPLTVRTGISYVSIPNASQNLAGECPTWDFDEVRDASRSEWNSWLGRIDVKGGTAQQREKFYTDLWHTLLGRHRINDRNGDYPDRTHLIKPGYRCKGGDDFVARRVPCAKDGTPLHNMYNTDALWLTQWNQNTIWGLAYPEIIDDISASMLQYAYNGGLLPRGPSGGGYSFIMSGCPATSLITSAYQRGITHCWNPRKALPVMLANHDKGGMLSARQDSEFEVYLTKGYAPERGGLTVQWTFEDWALSQMARAMGKKRDADRLEARSRGWRHLVHPDIHLILPRRTDGSWLHTDPLNGWGFEESNSWQTTFGLSHDIPGLAEAMGGSDTLCTMLDFAMRESIPLDFTDGYGNGYVSYANQPGLSTAHVFSHAGKPWLTQYWVRQVKERAYGSTSPCRGYGGHDEDQGQMGCVSALMAMGLFSINGGSAINPSYEITSPVFDEITIRLNPEYYSGDTFRIVTHNNSADNCYIHSATLNGAPHNSFLLPHSDYSHGGTLELWLADTPNTSWGLD